MMTVARFATAEKSFPSPFGMHRHIQAISDSIHTSLGKPVERRGRKAFGLQRICAMAARLPNCIVQVACVALFLELRAMKKITLTFLAMAAFWLSSSALAEIVATPKFHLAPVLLDTPDDNDARSNQRTARLWPRQQTISVEFGDLPTRRLTMQKLHERHNRYREGRFNPGQDSSPMAAGSTVTTYTPAQIRAAYGLPTLPAVGAAPTASQAAELGAGQTIYIVDAMHDPNAAAELAAFNQKFGLPTCSTKAYTTTPLPAAAKSGCEFAVVYSTTTGAITSTPPVYDAGWAGEIALDIQWAHAIAPMARIVLIEAPDAGVGTLTNAVRLANAMGSGIVSMSFGAPEGSWMSNYDAAFNGSGMLYLAATGDYGAEVEWPSVSDKVIGVGGTSLSYAGGGTPRYETVWSGTGGGSSSYVALPTYQNGMGVLSRTVADVAFNADPYTGQFVAIISPGSSTVNWGSYGGTSISTPQWAGLLAVTNAVLIANGRTPVAQAHSLLYDSLWDAPSLYYSAFQDVTSGNNGTCSACFASSGYDRPTGFGTPNGVAFINAVLGLQAPPSPPAVSSATINGNAYKSLSFSIGVQASNPVTYTLSGAPSGMTVSSAGVVTWASPALGTYKVTATAKDTKSGLSGSGLYTVAIGAAVAPVVPSGTISGKAYVALSFTATAKASNPVTWSLTGAPTGMSISSTGTVTWTSPLAGTYTVKVNAKDSKSSLTGTGSYTVQIAAATAPTVSSGTVKGVVGQSLTFVPKVSTTNTVTWSLSGAPSGMTIASNGAVTWSKAVAGTYTVKVNAKDSKSDLTGTGSWTLTVSAAGPVITANALTGKVGVPLYGTITLADATSSTLSLTLSGVPNGMMFYFSGWKLTAYWPYPVAGSYSITLVAKDGNGASTTKTIPVTITK
jgi:hypothetical protein